MSEITSAPEVGRKIRLIGDSWTHAYYYIGVKAGDVFTVTGIDIDGDPEFSPSDSYGTTYAALISQDNPDSHRAFEVVREKTVVDVIQAIDPKPFKLGVSGIMVGQYATEDDLMRNLSSLFSHRISGSTFEIWNEEEVSNV